MLAQAKEMNKKHNEKKTPEADTDEMEKDWVVVEKTVETELEKMIKKVEELATDFRDFNKKPETKGFFKSICEAIKSPFEKKKK